MEVQTPDQEEKMNEKSSTKNSFSFENVGWNEIKTIRPVWRDPILKATENPSNIYDRLTDLFLNINKGLEAKGKFPIDAEFAYDYGNWLYAKKVIELRNLAKIDPSEGKKKAAEQLSIQLKGTDDASSELFSEIWNEIVNAHNILNVQFDAKIWPLYCISYKYMKGFNLQWDFAMKELGKKLDQGIMSVFIKYKNLFGLSADKIENDLKNSSPESFLAFIFERDKRGGMMDTLNKNDWNSAIFDLDGYIVMQLYILYQGKKALIKLFDINEKNVANGIDKIAIELQNIVNKIYANFSSLGEKRVGLLKNILPNLKEYFPGYMEHTYSTIEDRNKSLYLGGYLKALKTQISILDTSVIPSLEKANDQYNKANVNKLKDRFQTYEKLLQIDVAKYKSDQKYRAEKETIVRKAKEYMKKKLGDELKKKTDFSLKTAIAKAISQDPYDQLSDSEKMKIHKYIESYTGNPKKSLTNKHILKIVKFKRALKVSLIVEYIDRKINEKPNMVELTNYVKIKNYILHRKKDRDEDPEDVPMFCREHKKECLRENICDTFLKQFGLEETYKQKYKEVMEQTSEEDLIRMLDSLDEQFGIVHICKLPPSEQKIEKDIYDSFCEAQRLNIQASVARNLEVIQKKSASLGKIDNSAKYFTVIDYSTGKSGKGFFNKIYNIGSSVGNFFTGPSLGGGILGKTGNVVKGIASNVGNKVVDFADKHKDQIANGIGMGIVGLYNYFFSPPSHGPYYGKYKMLGYE